MPKTLYLHIGTPKTGTTSLQTFLKMNSSLLLSYGYYNFDGISYNIEYFFNKSSAQTWYEHNRFKGKNRNEIEKIIKDELISKLDEYADYNWIISSEHLWEMRDNSDGLKNISKFFENYFDDIKILVTFRNQLDYFISSYFTRVNKEYLHERTLNFNDLQKSIMNPEGCKDLYYDSSIESFEKNFGQKNIIPTLYNDFRVSNDIYTNFLDNINLVNIDKFEFPKAINTSSFKLIQLKIYLNRFLPNHLKRNLISSNLTNLINDFLKSFYSYINVNNDIKVTKNVFDLWKNEFSKSNKNLYKKYFHKHLYAKDDFMFSKTQQDDKLISSEYYNNQFTDQLTEDDKNLMISIKAIVSKIIYLSNLSEDLAKENKIQKTKFSPVSKKAMPFSNSRDIIIKNVKGLFDDGWCSNKLEFNFINQKNTDSINIHLFNPLDKHGKLTIYVNNLEYLFNLDSKNHIFKIKLLLVEGRTNDIKIISTLDSSNVHDKRKLSYVLKQISFN